MATFTMNHFTAQLIRRLSLLRIRFRRASCQIGPMDDITFEKCPAKWHSFTEISRPFSE
jgi:hypothetical protein